MAKKSKNQVEEKILDVDASMQGSISFRDPVNLRINGNFEGSLETKGNLSIGENAIVRANIIGDSVVVSGKVYGDICASQSIALVSPAKVEGNLKAPVLSITSGAVIDGLIDMSKNGSGASIMNINEVAHYLDVEASVLEGWAKSKKIPSFQDDNKLKFKKSEIDKWVHEEKVNV